MGISHTPATAIFGRSIVNPSKTNRNGKFFRAKLNDEDDPLLQAAINAASLRFQETHRPEPLILDQYAGCFVTPHIQIDTKQDSLHYCLATKFIDDKLLATVNQIEGLKQVVLLTDGMDTRPYRLKWPASTIIFDISPDNVFKRAAEKLQGFGAKIPKGCLFRHVPSESTNIQESLRTKGFNGNRPSIWAMQGMPGMNLTNFEEILLLVSSLAMNGCFFLGELPAWLAETDIANKSSIRQCIEKVFMSNGFRVDMINHEELARSTGKLLESGDYKNILFVSEQLRFSDDQMETWRMEFQRIEEQGDEEGFEEL
ncbi:hypothetical protein UlMin_031191 [Ulmus minor]